MILILIKIIIITYNKVSIVYNRNLQQSPHQKFSLRIRNTVFPSASILDGFSKILCALRLADKANFWTRTFPRILHNLCLQHVEYLINIQYLTRTAY